jgi:tetratricopeptide (TPR) repeat protein
VHRAEATLGELLALLPDLDEFEVLQLRLMSEAFRDPGKQWASSSRFATVDKRLVTPEAAENALVEAEEALRQYIAAVYGGLRPVLRAFFEEDHGAVARYLVAMGEGLEQEGRLQGARKCYRSALTAALPLAEKSSQILALRRVGRVSLTLGDFQEAVSYYERSAELARDAGDVLGQVIARTGLGNVRMWQGRWSEAEPPYLAALELLDAAPAGEMALERGQLYNNLANLTTRQGKLDKAEEWFQSAFGAWESVSSPHDLAVCHFNHAHLRETQERWDEARESYEAALALPTPSSFRAMFATDFAELWVHEGHLTMAEEWAVVAEEHAIAAHSPYVLGHLYRGRGNIALARGDVDGFNFFEKALEIAREKAYVFLEGETLVDYAALRAQNGGVDEAVDFLKHACEIFRGLGALGELERAEKALAELSGREEPPCETEPPREAAD